MPNAIRSHAFRFGPPLEQARAAVARLPHPSWNDEPPHKPHRAVSAAEFWRSLGL